MTDTFIQVTKGAEPAETRTAACGAFRWNRQNSLDRGRLVGLLQRHEIVFYEDFRAHGHEFELIRRPTPAPGTPTGRPPSNDFWWFVGDRAVQTELKRPEPSDRDGDARDLGIRIKRSIRKSARAAAEHPVPCRKACFVIDLGERMIPDGLLEMLGRYNGLVRAGHMISPLIDEIWVWSRGRLHAVDLE